MFEKLRTKSEGLRMKRAALCFISLITCLSSLVSVYAQNIGINNSGTKPDPTAMLDVYDTTKGMLIPRMTTTQRNSIAYPAQSLQIYNTTDSCLEIYIGTVWHNIVCACVGPPSAPGIISGNTSPCISSSGNVYSIAAVVGATGYTWSVPAGAAITSGAGTTSITVKYSTASGNITVTASNSCGTSVAATLAIALNTSPASPAIPSGTASPLISTSSTYTIAPVSGAISYTWSVSTTNGSISGGQGTTSATVTFGGTPATMNICAYDSNTCGVSAPSCLTVTTTTCTITHGSITFNADDTANVGTLQTFTVPCGMTSITIQAYGAQGGNQSGGGSGGLGAGIRGTFAVTAGTVLDILVGQQGEPNWGGGGGGSFVTYASNNNILLIAGGGGGGGLGGAGSGGSSGTAGLTGTMGGAAGTGGANGGGGGGASGYGGGGGGGYCGNGGSAASGYYTGGSGANGCSNGANGTGTVYTCTPGMSFLNGGFGGTSYCYPSHGYGGYGGGGASMWGNECGGGGGGYSGGGGGGYSGNFGTGGGGGSINNGTNQSNASGVNSGNGMVVITY